MAESGPFEKVMEAIEHRSLEELYFLAIALILAFGVLQTTGTALNTERPVVSVISCSMYPQLHAGDILVVQNQGFSELEEGDIIVFSVEEASIEIDGVQFKVDGYSEAESTPAGDVSVEKIVTRGGDPIGARLNIDGTKVNLAEGRTKEIDGNTVTLNSVTGSRVPVVHRVVSKSNSSLATKGDNNAEQLEFEKSIRPEQIYGEMLFSIPRIGGVKLLVMDILGYNGDQPLAIDTYPNCELINTYNPEN
jgi:signal peptidase I